MKMSKRPSCSHFYGQTKKFRVGTLPSHISSRHTNENELETPDLTVPSDTAAALLYLKDKFPIEKFQGKLPPVILVHQIYSIIKCKTTVDRDVNSLQTKGTIRLFKLGGEEAALVVIYFDDLVNHIKQNCLAKPVINRFLKELLPKIQDVSIDKSLLQGDLGFTQHEIRIPNINAIDSARKHMCDALILTTLSTVKCIEYLFSVGFHYILKESE
ncbi:hypothetical protein C0J52_13596 [Blattella germanica]|nr:hypothetical protein C0J52_13596 [Blattella germanica]